VFAHLLFWHRHTEADKRRIGGLSKAYGSRTRLTMQHDPDCNAIAAGTLKRAPVVVWHVCFHLREPHLRAAGRAARMEEDASWNDFGFGHIGETAPSGFETIALHLLVGVARPEIFEMFLIFSCSGRDFCHSSCRHVSRTD